jgi:hypothetical protein
MKGARAWKTGGYGGYRSTPQNAILLYKRYFPLSITTNYYSFIPSKIKDINVTCYLFKIGEKNQGFRRYGKEVSVILEGVRRGVTEYH